MITFDWILIGIIAVIILIQTYRGAKDLDLVLFEMIAFLIAGRLSLQWSGSFSRMFVMNPGFILLFMFVLFTVILLIVARVVAKYAQFTLAPIDTWLSFIFGFITSWIIIFVFLRMLLLAYPQGTTFRVLFTETNVSIYEVIKKSEVSEQILEFKAIKSVGNFFNSYKFNK